MATLSSQLHPRIDALDARRLTLLEELQSWDEAALRAKPQAERWSALEILEHLVIAERIILQDLPPMEALQARQRGLRNRILYRLVWLILRFAIPVKVPTRKMNPTGGLSLEEVRSRWDENLRWVRGYAEELATRADDPAVFLHPVAGPLTLGQALEMDRLHLEVHARQLQKLGRA